MLEIILCLILIFIILYVIYYIKYTNDNLVYIKATADNNYYWVRNTKDNSAAANVLAEIKKRMINLVDHLKKTKDTHDGYTTYITDLVRRTKEIYIMESTSEDKFTSYTVNKGEKIIFCLRSKILNTIHDINTLMYVVIHELAHVACPEFGHTPLFKKIFKFLLKESVIIDIYKKTNYRENPQLYCGMTINEYLFDD
jgi:predicted metal-dependent hydrolase